MLNLRDFVREHGGDLYEGARRAVIPGPGHSRRDRSLSLRLSPDGERVVFHSFAGDACRDIMAYLGIEARHSQEASPAERAKLRRAREEERRRVEAADRALCQEIWSQTEPFEGSLAETYLWSRGLILENCSDIRFHPAAPRAKPRQPGDDRPLPTPHPAMVAVVRGKDGASQSLHLTYVALDGKGKAFGDRSRLMFGPMRGGSVHLTPGAPIMAVGEGLETCLAYRSRTGVAIWAALTTSGYATFEPPSRTRQLIVAADGDNGGLSASTAMAARLRRLCDVRIDPAPDGQDWADVLEAEIADV